MFSYNCCWLGRRCESQVQKQKCWVRRSLKYHEIHQGVSKILVHDVYHSILLMLQKSYSQTNCLDVYQPPWCEFPDSHRRVPSLFSACSTTKKTAPSKLQKTHSKNHRKSVTCLKPCFLIRKKTRWWFQKFFNIHPYLGKIPILANMFQMGWFNHQPEGHWNGFLFFHSKLSSLSLTFHPRYFPKTKPGELHTFLWNHGVFLPPQKMAGIRKWIHFCTHVEELLFGLPVTQRLENMLTLRGKKKIQVWKENDVFCWIVLYFIINNIIKFWKQCCFHWGSLGPTTTRVLLEG